MSVAIYCRVSTAEQAEHGYSIGEQIKRTKKYCEAMKWPVYGVFADPGFSGASMDRPGLQKLISAIEDGGVSRVLVYKLDRLSRSQKDTLYLIEDIFLSHNVDFVSMSENFDTGTAFGRAMVGILSVFAQLERETIKERTKMGLDARAKSGKYHGSRWMPIGYKYENGALIPYEYEAAIIRRIFEEYAAGRSCGDIADDLNNDGLTRPGSLWSRQIILRVIQTETYIGHIKHCGKWVPGVHPPIIDQALWDAAQSRRNARAAQSGKHPGNIKTSLGGLLVCAQCGAPYWSHTYGVKGNGKTYRYQKYVCRNSVPRFRLPGSEPCHNAPWPAAKLEKIIVSEISKIKIDAGRMKTKRKQKEDLTPAVTAELEKTEKQISALLDLYSSDAVPLDVLNDKIRALNDRRQQLSAALEKTEHTPSAGISREEIKTVVKDIKTAAKLATPEELHDLIASVVDHIEIDGDDLTFFWKF